MGEGVGVVAGLIEKTEEVAGGGSEKEEEVVVVVPEGNVDLFVTNLGNNTRRVEARIAIQAPLEAVWGVLTAYDHLADHIPGLAESRVLELRPNGARLLQVIDSLLLILFISTSLVLKPLEGESNCELLIEGFKSITATMKIFVILADLRLPK